MNQLKQIRDLPSEATKEIDTIRKAAKDAGFQMHQLFPEEFIVRHSNGSWVNVTDKVLAFAELINRSAQADVATLRAENERLRHALNKIDSLRGPFMTDQQIEDVWRTVDAVLKVDKS